MLKVTSSNAMRCQTNSQKVKEMDRQWHVTGNSSKSLQDEISKCLTFSIDQLIIIKILCWLTFSSADWRMDQQSVSTPVQQEKGRMNMGRFVYLCNMIRLALNINLICRLKVLSSLSWTMSHFLKKVSLLYIFCNTCFTFWKYNTKKDKYTSVMSQQVMLLWYCGVSLLNFENPSPEVLAVVHFPFYACVTSFTASFF